MKIVTKTFSEKGLENFDYRSYLAIEVDGKMEVEFLDGEPEDANLSRDFGDCYLIPSLMRKAYEAGKNGESFELEEIKIDDL